MTCQACGRENPADARFCAGCGTPLSRPCPDCGRPAAADAAFCAGCGRRLDRPPPVTPPPAPPRPPEHIAEKARASRAALEGERKQVTVLFADVKGSMELQEDLDPEDWHAVMDRFMRILADGVHRFEGTVDKFTGDGVMALFGAPVAHEDHARRACYAALHLAETIGHYADELRRTKGLSFHVRIGLNSGQVIVGTIGDDSHMEYTAVGHVLVESYPGTRTLLLTNFRPEFAAGWMRHSYYRQLPLATLDAAAVRELLRELLGTDTSLRELSDHILTRTGGNPFFVEEVVRNLIEEKTLEGAPGAYRLTRPLHDLRVPPTVQSLLSARIDRLPSGDKELLQTAAVIGRTFSEPVLRRVTGLTADDFGASVQSLGAAEFIQEETLYPIAEYRFWHPLTQEVAYGSLLGERRARLHAAVADAIADLEPDRADERAALLAQHWEAAGEPLEAARWHARAAHRAGFRDMVQAQRHWQATVRLLADVPTSDETRELGMTARARLARIAFRFGGDPDESVALLDQARDLAAERDDPFGIGMATVAKGFVVLGHGRIDDSIELMSESIHWLKEAGEEEAMAARALIAYPLSIRGPLPAALRHTDETVDHVLSYPAMGERLFGLKMPHYNLFWRAWTLARMGRFDEAAEAADQAEAAGWETSMPEIVAWARPVHALIAFLSNDAAGAVDHALESVRLADELGSAFHSVLALEGLGAAYLAADRGAEARRPLADGLALAHDRHVGLFEEASLLAYLAEAHRSAGDDGAVEAAEAAVAVARRQNAGVHECQALVAYARALRTAGGTGARGAVGDVVAAAHRTIERVGATAWSPFLAEQDAWLAEVAR